MPRVVQTVAFFALLGTVLLLSGPHSGGAERLSILVAGAVVSAMITHVLPWVYALDTEPVSASEE